VKRCCLRGTRSAARLATKRAIYARTSTDQGAVPDEQRAVSCQIEHTRAFAATYDRGKTTCAASGLTPMEALDRAVLDALRDDVLRPEVVTRAVELALEAFDVEPDNGRVTRAKEQHAAVRAECGRLASAIAAGGPMPTLVGLLQEREREFGELEGQLAVLTRLRPRRSWTARRCVSSSRTPSATGTSCSPQMWPAGARCSADCFIDRVGARRLSAVAARRGSSSKGRWRLRELSREMPRRVSLWWRASPVHLQTSRRSRNRSRRGFFA
jgi:hypothetical protein